MRFTIVVGTGRCGSTMLSRLLSTHPDVLSLSEFFGIVRLASGGGPAQIPVGDLTGEELWKLLASDFPPLDAMITAGLRTSEMAYPGGRFSPQTGIPLVSQYVLPMLSDTPDDLFDLLAQQVSSWPRRPAADHYLALFGYLAELLHRPVIVERSASSLLLIPVLHALFPDARFVHLFRDGADCALSMSKHPAFRREILAAGIVRELGEAGRLPAGTTLKDVDALLPERFRGLIWPPYDANKLMTVPLAPEVFAANVWSPLIRAGVAALDELAAGHWMAMRYERLLSDPAGELTALLRYMEANVPDVWLRQAEKTIDATRTGTAAAQLDDAELARLRAACEPGELALSRSAGHR